MAVAPPLDERRVPLGADAKVRPPSIHLPRTLAPPYKSNPILISLYRAAHGDFPPQLRRHQRR
jgi:hypothetical protein